MTKKLFLAAASVAAMAFAGGASAGTISGTVAGQAFNGGTTPASYVVASETTIPTGAPLLTAGAGFVVNNTLTTPISVVDGTTQNYTVKFEIAGGTIPAGAVVTPVALNGVTPIVGGVTFAAAGRTATSVTYVATVTATGANVDVTAFRISTQLQVASKAAPVTASASVDLLAGGSSFNVDTASAVNAVEFKALLKGLSTTSNTAVANLPDFKVFKSGVGTAPLTNSDLTAELASNFSAANAGTFYKDLIAGPVTVANILTGGTVTVTGPQALSANLAPALTAGGTRTFVDGAAVFVLDATQAAAFAGAAGTTDLTLTEAATAANRVAMAAGGYTVAWTPAIASGFVAAPASSSTAAGSISLDGVNIIAPWVSGTGAATSVIRLGNSAATASGPVTVRLRSAVKVVAGVATPVTSDVVYAAGTVPANGDLQITSSQLVAAFGDFTRGDFQVTIQSSAAPLTAKLRNTRDGTTFEQSLGAGL